MYLAGKNWERDHTPVSSAHLTETTWDVDTQMRSVARQGVMKQPLKEIEFMKSSSGNQAMTLS